MWNGNCTGLQIIITLFDMQYNIPKDIQTADANGQYTLYTSYYEDEHHRDEEGHHREGTVWQTHTISHMCDCTSPFGANTIIIVPYSIMCTVADA